MKEYKIVGLSNNQITLEYDGITRNFPLPIHDGLYPEGEELDALLTRYVQIQRENVEVIPTATNEDAIKSLVETPTVTVIKLKHQRNRLLGFTDKFVLPDAPITNLEAWKTYRQDLRDLPNQLSFPNIVIWPIPPVQLKNPMGVALTNTDGSPAQQ